MTSSTLLDRLGITLSLACTAHCVLTPFVVVLLPVFGTTFRSSWVHVVFAAVLVPVGLFAFWRGFRRSGRVRAMAIGSVGLSLLMWVLALQDRACCEGETSPALTFTNILGSLIVVIGHRLNLHDCSCCHGVDHVASH